MNKSRVILPTAQQPPVMGNGNTANNCPLWAMASMPTIANAQRPTTANHANTAYHWGNGTAWRG
ncbi:hypothetical protein NKT77_10015 [Moraxella sp. FZLJ2107]|uniref:hypothetical protein n=1 Tax=unclassified Moraxella TaxID=2685852 RepID=UPI0020C8D7E9|nr:MULTISPECIES: hypothetical protein [unclassified Moraxella]UTO04774.1 hypothetical protein NKT77_09770 [Moraxella sp. FZLJ2107]UTO04811.1 hypothetical protein NKT77_09955 [Moraxella sp. FZLJ2107]UTO04823.1 hypothetical protein NKT77_10015 [Moraxella sp. FZLJ2107]UTO21506.1 hypothetical protein NKU06_06575 [Moraxella sp. FZLJ2109]UTO21544.1 hypothetical protein NKU06_06765 [Moraxella sp. FZLJ2109]